MRRDPQHPFHKHQLRPMMHLVLFYCQEHVEANARRRRPARGHGHRSAQKPILKGFQPFGELIPTLGQQLQDIRLRAARLLVRQARPNEAHEIEPRHRIALLRAKDFVHKVLYVADMDQHLSHASHLRRGPESIVLLANVFRDLNRIVADRAERGRKFFSAVIVHGDYCIRSKTQDQPPMQFLSKSGPIDDAKTQVSLICWPISPKKEGRWRRIFFAWEPPESGWWRSAEFTVLIAKARKQIAA